MTKKKSIDKPIVLTAKKMADIFFCLLTGYKPDKETSDKLVKIIEEIIKD